MPIQPCADPVGKLATISNFLLTPHKGKLLDENLEVVSKSGPKWYALALAAPLMNFLGIDVYSHVRIYRVAHALLLFCESHYEKLKENPRVIQLVENLLTQLQAKHKKYTGDIERECQILRRFYPPIPQNYLMPKWPQDLATIGMTEPDRQNLDQLFKEIRDTRFQYELRFTKQRGSSKADRTLFLHVRGWTGTSPDPSSSCEVPCSMRITYSSVSPGFIERIVFMTKHTLGKGGETRVRRCYDLLTGERLAKKRTDNYCYKELVTFIRKKSFPGVVPIVDMSTDKMKPKVLHFFEPEYAGTLEDLLDQWRAGASRAPLLPIMGDILQGVVSFHDWTMPQLTRTLTNGQQDVVPRFALFHTDLKDQNVLVKQIDGVWRAVIADFGSSDPWIITSTVGSRPPEVVRELQQQASSPVSIRTFKLKYGQKIDMWQLGIMFSTILCESDAADEKEFSPLPLIQRVIKDALQTQAKNTDLLEEGLARYTGADQDEMTVSLNALNQRTGGHYLPFWRLMSNHMLRFDPDERVTAELAWQEFSQLTDI